MEEMEERTAKTLRQDAEQIIAGAIKKVQPDEAVAQALSQMQLGSGSIYVVAAGKAAWQMAKAASVLLDGRDRKSVV